MKQLMALAFSLILFATYATSQCSNASMRGIFYHCTSCGGGVVLSKCVRAEVGSATHSGLRSTAGSATSEAREPVYPRLPCPLRRNTA